MSGEPNQAHELGELIGALLARSEQPNINLNVPDVHVRAELDASGLIDLLRGGFDANAVQFRGTMEALAGVLMDVLSKRSAIDFSTVVDALTRSGDASKPIDYTNIIKLMIAALDAQTVAQKTLTETIATAADRLERALRAGKTISYDDKGRVIAVKVT